MIKGSAVFENKDVKMDGAVETNVYSVQYEISSSYSAGMLYTGDLETTHALDTNKVSWKLSVFDGTVLQGESAYPYENAQRDVIDALTNHFKEERKGFRLTKTDDHRYLVKTSHREVALSFDDEKVEFNFLDLGFARKIDAGNLEEEIATYLKKQDGKEEPVADNIYWVFWFSRYFNDEKMLKMMQNN